MLNPITALTTTIASTITTRTNPSPHRQVTSRHHQVTSRQPQQPAGTDGTDLALLAIRDEHGRPLAGVYVPDHLLLF